MLVRCCLVRISYPANKFQCRDAFHDKNKTLSQQNATIFTKFTSCRRRREEYYFFVNGLGGLLNFEPIPLESSKDYCATHLFRQLLGERKKDEDEKVAGP